MTIIPNPVNSMYFYSIITKNGFLIVLNRAHSLQVIARVPLSKLDEAIAAFTHYEYSYKQCRYSLQFLHQLNGALCLKVSTIIDETLFSFVLAVCIITCCTIHFGQAQRNS